jgi:hypothetical protein
MGRNANFKNFLWCAPFALVAMAFIGPLSKAGFGKELSGNLCLSRILEPAEINPGELTPGKPRPGEFRPVSQSWLDAQEGRKVPRVIRSHKGTESYFWASFGAGLGSYGFSGGASVNWQVGRRLVLTVRARASEEMMPLLGSALVRESSWEVHPMIGICLARSSLGYFSASIGVGLTGGEERGEYLDEGGWSSGESAFTESFLTVGFAGRISLVLTPSKFFGIGINAFTSIHSNLPNIGGEICFQFGMLRNGS